LNFPSGDTDNFQKRKIPESQKNIGRHFKAVQRSRCFSSEMLAVRCGSLGWDIGGNGITKILSGTQDVTDSELAIFARALLVKLRDMRPRLPAFFWELCRMANLRVRPNNGARAVPRVSVDPFGCRRNARSIKALDQHRHK
jgi:hypothetical protein